MARRVHEQLARLVRDSGLSRSELARRLGVSPPQVSNWLNGRVPIPDSRFNQIRDVLLGARASDARGAMHGAPLRNTESGRYDGYDWRFVLANPNAGKDFGNAGIYATPQSIPSLVRETGQNSLDAAANGLTTMRFTLFELGENCDRRDKFLDAMRFEDSLREHIELAAASGGSTKIGTKLAAGLAALDSELPLRILRIEDFGCRGLRGEEHDSDEPFSALVRDNLNSRKALATAGGVFGIGSKTLWACSRLSTVLFSTIIDGEEERGVRMIGKADLAYHEATSSGERFSGAGWLGTPVGDDGAESLWLPANDPLLERLLLTRIPPGQTKATGTTALIVSFYDPKADDEEGEAVVKRFARAAADSFWPAMVNERLDVHVERVVDDETEPREMIHVDADEYVPALTDAYRKHLRGDTREKLEKIGDTVSVPVMLDLPATRAGGGVEPQHPALTAECRLVIRLADPASTGDAWVEHVAYARGLAMVTKYERRSSVTTGARPFHAVLLAGTLAGPGQHERAAEQFLRFAEPTAHDDWSLNGDLKERYAYGAGARIRELYERVVKALQQYVKTDSLPSSEGPAILKEIFSLRVPPQPAATTKWRLRQATARPVGDGWHVEAEVVIERSTKPFKLVPRVSYEAEMGRGSWLRWRALTSDDVDVDDQALMAPAGTRRVRFSGAAVGDDSAPENDRCAVELNVQMIEVEA